MKPRSILTVVLLTVFLLAACAPVASPEPAPSEKPFQPHPEATETLAQPESLPTESHPQAVQSEAPATEPPQAIATSRGPNLEATDPSTVSLAAGDLQLVEFFRFT